LFSYLVYIFVTEGEGHCNSWLGPLRNDVLVFFSIFIRLEIAILIQNVLFELTIIQWFIYLNFNHIWASWVIDLRGFGYGRSFKNSIFTIFANILNNNHSKAFILVSIGTVIHVLYINSYLSFQEGVVNQKQHLTIFEIVIPLYCEYYLLQSLHYSLFVL
jgi:hypothetical protein